MPDFHYVEKLRLYSFSEDQIARASQSDAVKHATVCVFMLITSDCPCPHQGLCCTAPASHATSLSYFTTLGTLPSIHWRFEPNSRIRSGPTTRTLLYLLKASLKATRLSTKGRSRQQWLPCKLPLFRRRNVTSFRSRLDTDFRVQKSRVLLHRCG
jgi:hypothetical protein